MFYISYYTTPDDVRASSPAAVAKTESIAKAFGANGFFFEVHPDPDNGLSDGPNMLRLDDLELLFKSLL